MNDCRFDYSNLTQWEKQDVPVAAITYSNGVSTFEYTMSVPSYERVYMPIILQPNTDYVFTATLNVIQMPEGHNRGDGTYIGVITQKAGMQYIKADYANLIVRALADNSGVVTFTFNSGPLTLAYLYIDWADVTNDQRAVIEYSNIILECAESCDPLIPYVCGHRSNYLPVTGCGGCPPVRIEITRLPIKTVYRVGETIDLSGIIVRAFKANGNLWGGFPHGIVPTNTLAYEPHLVDESALTCLVPDDNPYGTQLFSYCHNQISGIRYTNAELSFEGNLIFILRASGNGYYDVWIASPSPVSGTSFTWHGTTSTSWNRLKDEQSYTRDERTVYYGKIVNENGTGTFYVSSTPALEEVGGEPKYGTLFMGCGIWWL